MTIANRLLELADFWFQAILKNYSDLHSGLFASFNQGVSLRRADVHWLLGENVKAAPNGFDALGGMHA
jgi:hypothetical protein